MSREPTNLELAYLESFERDTYGLAIPSKVAREMVLAGWVEWVPPKYGTMLFAITDEGRRALGAKKGSQ